ncbi:MAG TPA: ribosome silencing factor [Aquihabitans sp.]|nr:ribosome silencing factor [Aquihabitans sp.]
MPDAVEDAAPLEWAVVAARAADAKNAEDVVVLEVGPVMAVCEHFVIASGSNTRLVRTVAEEVEAKVAEAGGPRPIRVEGLDDLKWVLLDYGDFVVHVFLDETRRYYDLERLWSDVPRTPWKADAGVAGSGPDGASAGGSA